MKLMSYEDDRGHPPKGVCPHIENTDYAILERFLPFLRRPAEAMWLLANRTMDSDRPQNLFN